MALARISGVRFAGISCTVPEPTGSINDFFDTFGKDFVETYSEKTGVKKWHYATQNICISDLCFTAADRLLNDLSWERDSVDLLVVASHSLDYGVPATSCILQNSLGLSKDCAALDISHGGSGYIYGIWIISSLMSAGKFNRAILLAGDAIRKTISPQDRQTSLLFGDAGSATAFECCDSSEFLTIAMGTDGTGLKKQFIPAGGHRLRWSDQTRIIAEREAGNYRADDHLCMDGPELLNATMKEIKPMLNTVLSEHEWEKEMVDNFVLHQSSKQIIETLSDEMGLPSEKVPLSLENYGNTTSASIPMTMVNNMGYLKERSSNLAMAGFGAGYSWGACAATVGPVIMPELSILKIKDVPIVEIPGK